jgi:hypothetical protein
VKTKSADLLTFLLLWCAVVFMKNKEQYLLSRFSLVGDEEDLGHVC